MDCRLSHIESTGTWPRARRGTRRLTWAAPALLASAVLATACSPGDPTGPDPATASLLHPAAGEVIAIGTQQIIEWEPSAEVTNVDVELSSPDGSIEVIAQDIQNKGRYEWTVPLVHSVDPRSYTLNVRPTLQSSSGDPPAAVAVGKSLAVGSVAGFKWNGASEDYYWVDLVTGQSQTLGTVGDMKVWEWKGGAAFDAPNSLIYVVASPDDAESVWKIYTLNAATGALVADVAIQGKHPASLKVSSSGEVLGLSWNGSQEELSVIDPATGAVTVRGTVGGFAVWSNESAIDNAHDRLYVIGTDEPGFDPMAGPDPNAPWSVFTLDSLTGALLDTKPLSPPESGLTGVVTTSAGDLVGFRWNGSQEELVRIDPATGAISVLGTVGDLTLWSGYTAINPTTNDIYVFGDDPASTSKLYTINAITGDLLYDLAVTDSPSSALLVY